MIETAQEALAEALYGKSFIDYEDVDEEVESVLNTLADYGFMVVRLNRDEYERFKRANK